MWRNSVQSRIPNSWESLKVWTKDQDGSRAKWHARNSVAGQSRRLQVNLYPAVDVCRCSKKNSSVSSFIDEEDCDHSSEVGTVQGG